MASPRLVAVASLFLGSSGMRTSPGAVGRELIVVGVAGNAASAAISSV